MFHSSQDGITIDSQMFSHADDGVDSPVDSVAGTTSLTFSDTAAADVSGSAVHVTRSQTGSSTNS